MMRMKKFLTGFVLAIFVFAMIFCFVACEEDTKENEHVHSFSAWNITTAPSCTLQGIQVRACASCGISEYAPLAATGHTEVDDAAVAVTCTADGKTAGKHCGACGTVLAPQTTIPSLGHQYNGGEIDPSATCSQNGVKKFTCTIPNCGHSYTEEYALPNYTANELYQQSLKYVGEIVTYNKSGSRLALGTGFVLSSDGKIVTNYHVIENAYSAEITIDGTTYDILSVLAYDADIDLAVLKINASGLTAATVCKKPVAVGSTVYAIGSSRGMTNTYSQGIVTYFDRVVDGVSHVQHDASITNGNSGGPLINAYGEVIGINTWGYRESQNLNFAVFGGELDNLSYGQEISLSELYEANYSTYDALLDWLLGNYNASTETQARYDVYGANERHSLVYDSSYDLLYLDAAWRFEGGAELSVLLIFSEGTSKYEYIARYAVGNYQNTTRGVIDASTFTETTELTYIVFQGDHWEKSGLLELYRAAMVDLLGWFEVASTECGMEITLRDLGFSVLEITPEEKFAEEVLLSHIISHGIYDFDSDRYEIEQAEQETDMIVLVSLNYQADERYMFASVIFYMEDGSYFSFFLYLTPTAEGLNYVGQCGSLNENGEIENLFNTTWGYVDPTAFTSETVLTFEEYNGLSEQQAELLNTYSICLQGVLDWMNSYFASESLDITVADLGFVSFIPTSSV